MSGGGAASEFGHPLRKFKLVFLGEQSGKPTPRDYLGAAGFANGGDGCWGRILHRGRGFEDSETE